MLLAQAASLRTGGAWGVLTAPRHPHAPRKCRAKDCRRCQTAAAAVAGTETFGEGAKDSAKAVSTLHHASTLLPMAASVAARALGVAREVTIGRILGLSPAVDAFSYATQVSAFCMTTIGALNGPTHVALAPMIAYRGASGAAAAMQVSAALLVASLALWGVLHALTPSVLQLIAPGLLKQPATHELAIHQMHVLLSGMPATAIAGIGTALLVAKGCFWLPALAPALASAVTVAALCSTDAQALLQAALQGSTRALNATPGALALAGGTAAGYWLQAAVLTVAAALAWRSIRHNPSAGSTDVVTSTEPQLAPTTRQPLTAGSVIETPSSQEEASSSASGSSGISMQPSAQALLRSLLTPLPGTGPALRLMASATLTAALMHVAACTDLTFASFVPGLAAAWGYATLLAFTPTGVVLGGLLAPLAARLDAAVAQQRTADGLQQATKLLDHGDKPAGASEDTRAATRHVGTPDLHPAAQGAAAVQVFGTAIRDCMVVVLPLAACQYALAAPAVDALLAHRSAGATAALGPAGGIEAVVLLTRMYSVSAVLFSLREMLTRACYSLHLAAPAVQTAAVAVVVKATTGWAAVLLGAGPAGVGIMSITGNVVACTQLLWQLSRRLPVGAVAGHRLWSIARTAILACVAAVLCGCACYQTYSWMVLGFAQAQVYQNVSNLLAMVTACAVGGGLYVACLRWADGLERQANPADAVVVSDI